MISFAGDGHFTATTPLDVDNLIRRERLCITIDPDPKGDYCDLDGFLCARHVRTHGGGWIPAWCKQFMKAAIWFSEKEFQDTVVGDIKE